MAATFAFLPPRAPEELTRTLKWRQALFSIGLAWLLFGFFGYLRFKVAPGLRTSSSTSSLVRVQRSCRRWKPPPTC